MNDFLSKFEDENYDGEHITPNNDINNPNIPTNNQQNNIGDDEIIVKDNNYSTKMKKRRLWLIGGSISAVLLIGMIFILFALVRVPNFVDTDLSQAKTWAQKNDIHLIVNQEYSTDKDENIIIEQDKTKDQRVFKGSNLILVVSIGADPDEKIAVPNLMYMSVGEINDWIAKNKLDNVEIKGVYSSKQPKDKVVSINYVGDFVNAGNFYRKDGMIINVSKGKASLRKNIEVPDFKTTDVHEVRDWAEENGVTVQYLYSTHPKKEKDGIIKQSIKANTKISRTQNLTVTVSLGRSVRVPDFSAMSQAAASSSSLNTNVRVRYSNSVAYGKLISQSVAPGRFVTSSTRVTVTYSEGRPFIDDISGSTKKDVERYFYNLNQKGAKLSYRFEYTNSGDVPKNRVVRTSIQDNYAKIGQTIVVFIKR